MTDRHGRNVNLDLIRGMAALEVVIHHLRNYRFQDQITNASFFDKTFHFIFALGNEAVMVFFVLSGYFIGGSVIDNVQKNAWSWSDYLTKRLVRLWVALVPALLLTFFWDNLGMMMKGRDLYTDRYKSIMDTLYALDLKTFFENLFFSSGFYLYDLWNGPSALESCR